MEDGKERQGGIEERGKVEKGAGEGRGENTEEYVEWKTIGDRKADRETDGQPGRGNEQLRIECIEMNKK
jgi:hypothetical protein